MQKIYKSSIVLFLGFLIFYLYDPSKDKKEEIKKPKSPNIKNVLFGHQEYDEIIKTFNSWENESPELIDVETYGKTKLNKETYYLKISNEYNPSDKIVLITSCIHGNEPLATSTLMCFMANLINDYGKDPEVTDLIDTRTIYFIPVVSPDSYPNKRHVDGVDPNRNFSKENSIKPVQNLKNLFLKIKPKSVLSGHTYGRIFLIPWGDTENNNPNQEDYIKIAKKMCEYSKYKYQRACEMYNKPIFGTEIDWFHKNGSFSIVMEFGTHQKKSTLEESKKEFERTSKAIKFFIKESIEITIKN
jgi:hypothetical protein